jgi:IS30 family transposase
MRCIARRLGRSAATVSRELRRNADRPAGGYRATTAHALAWERAGRPKPAKLATNLALRGKVEEYLAQRYSPEQIAGRLRVEYPDDPQCLGIPGITAHRAVFGDGRWPTRRSSSTACSAGSD